MLIVLYRDYTPTPAIDSWLSCLNLTLGTAQPYNFSGPAMYACVFSSSLICHSTYVIRYTISADRELKNPEDNLCRDLETSLTES